MKAISQQGLYKVLKRLYTHMVIMGEPELGMDVLNIADMAGCSLEGPPPPKCEGGSLCFCTSHSDTWEDVTPIETVADNNGIHKGTVRINGIPINQY